MNTKAFRVTALAAAMAGSLALTAYAQEQGTDVGALDKAAAEKVYPAKPPYSPYAARTCPTRPFFGDTHLTNDEFADNELWDKGNLDASVAKTKEMLESNQGNEEGNQR